MVSVISRFVREIPGELIDRDKGNIYVVSKPSEYNGGLPARNDSKEDFKKKPFALSGGPGAANKPLLDFGVGDRVDHMKFGEGIVTEINDGGRDWEVTVDFEEVGTKKMFASFAKLKKV